MSATTPTIDTTTATTVATTAATTAATNEHDSMNKHEKSLGEEDKMITEPTSDDEEKEEECNEGGDENKAKISSGPKKTVEEPLVFLEKITQMTDKMLCENENKRLDIEDVMKKLFKEPIIRNHFPNELDSMDCLTNCMHMYYVITNTLVRGKDVNVKKAATELIKFLEHNTDLRCNKFHTEGLTEFKSRGFSKHSERITAIFNEFDGEVPSKLLKDVSKRTKNLFKKKANAFKQQINENVKEDDEEGDTSNDFDDDDTNSKKRSREVDEISNESDVDHHSSESVSEDLNDSKPKKSSKKSKKRQISREGGDDNEVYIESKLVSGYKMIESLIDDVELHDLHNYHSDIVMKLKSVVYDVQKIIRE